MPSLQFTGPTPPAGRRFCLLCAADWKATAIVRAQSQGIDLAKASHLDLLRLMDGQLPEVAVAETTMTLPAPAAAGAPPGQQMVITGDACWSHLQAIKVMDTALAVAGAGPFAGAVDLGMRR